MRYVTALLLVLVGCAKATPAKTPIAGASMDDCTQVYGRMLAISLVQNLDPDHSFSKAETEAGIRLLDKQYQEQGTTQKFFGYCRNKLNTEQVSCMLGANSFEDMSLCDKMFASK